MAPIGDRPWSPPRRHRFMVPDRPSTLADLFALHGMDEARTERFGAAFLDILREG